MPKDNGQDRRIFEAEKEASARSEREKDAFWEIDMLVPKTGTAPRRAPGATDTTEISFGPPAMRSNSERQSVPVGDSPLNLNPKDGEVVVRHFVPPHTGSGMASEPVTEEHPVIAYENERGLIHKVQIYRWSSRYHYYRDFCADAARYLGCEPADDVVYNEPVRFFSYVPQYSQLRPEQLDYYFYWRREFRRGNTPDADDSYLYLYIYELLNTAGFETKPEDGLLMLYRLFRTYGRTNARLSRLLSEWIVDYSLIFRLSVPGSERSSSDFHRVYGSTLKEFYISSPNGGASGYAELLMRHCSAYDYRKSHFYTGNNRAYFDRFLPGALSVVLEQYSSGDRLFVNARMNDSRMVRNAFEQALCSYRIRYRIEVDYASFSRSHEMRFFVSDILKYTENRLRGFLGIKSKLSVYALSAEVRKCIDCYCDESFPRKTAELSARKKEETPSYEKLYDLPDSPLSLTHAAEIELDSWETTRRLTEAFSDTEEDFEVMDGASVPAPIEIAPAEAESESDPPEVGIKAVLGILYPFAEAAYRADYSAQHAFSAERGMLPDLLADEINELAADAFGDILLEESDGGYTVIEDYRSLFERTEP